MGLHCSGETRAGEEASSELSIRQDHRQVEKGSRASAHSVPRAIGAVRAKPSFPATPRGSRACGPRPRSRVPSPAPPRPAPG